MPLDSSYLQGQSGQRPAMGWAHTGATQESPFPLLARIGYRNWVAPIAASLTSFVNAVTPGPNTTTFTYTRTGTSPVQTNVGTFLAGVPFNGANPTGQMDWPRNVVITVTHASSVVAESGVIYGVDEFNRLISETWSVTATGVSKTYTGAKAFARVDAITVTAASDASANTNNAGHGSVLGLPWRHAIAGTGVAVKETMDGAILVTGVYTKAVAGAATDAQGTYLPATIPNGTHNYEVWFLVNDPQS
jgi:hypothetical protein